MAAMGLLRRALGSRSTRTLAVVLAALVVAAGCGGDGDGDGDGASRAEGSVSEEPVRFEVDDALSVTAADGTSHPIRSIAVAGGDVWVILADPERGDVAVQISMDPSLPDGDQFVGFDDSEASVPLLLDAEGDRVWAIEQELDGGDSRVLAGTRSGEGFSLGDIHGALTRLTPEGWFTFSTYVTDTPTAKVADVNAIDDIVELVDEADPASFADNLDFDAGPEDFEGIGIETLDIPYEGATATAQSGDLVYVAGRGEITVVDASDLAVAGSVTAPGLDGEVLLAATEDLVVAASGGTVRAGAAGAGELDTETSVDATITSVAAIGTAVVVTTESGAVFGGNPFSDRGLVEIEGVAATVLDDGSYAIGTWEDTFYLPDNENGQVAQVSVVP